jgi:phospholipid/cholesterol/gamma-HCH transport system ATP-binding protein
LTERNGGTPQRPADVVVFDHVSIGFDGHPVLSDVSFRVAHGEMRIVLGPAGGGKSVLLKLVDGLIQPDSGDIRIFGQPIQNATEEELTTLRSRIGMVFQESALFDSLDVRDNVGYRLEQENLPADVVNARVEEALRFVEMEHTLDKFPPELSGGMRRRVAIARAIVTQPELLLYDSPTGGLDPITSATIIELVVEQRDVHQATSLLVTHRMQDAFALAAQRFNPLSGRMESLPHNATDAELDAKTKFLVLREGRVVFDGGTRDLVHSSDPWLRDFMS